VLIPNFNLLLDGQGSKRVLEVVKFVRNLKALMHSVNGVCLITVDEDLLPKTFVPHLTLHADLILKLTSFLDHQELRIGDYDGTLKLLK
jgi:archaellum biogenesis ATPase FlaH